MTRGHTATPLSPVAVPPVRRPASVRPPAAPPTGVRHAPPDPAVQRPARPVTGRRPALAAAAAGPRRRAAHRRVPRGDRATVRARRRRAGGDLQLRRGAAEVAALLRGAACPGRSRAWNRVVLARRLGADATAPTSGSTSPAAGTTPATTSSSASRWRSPTTMLAWGAVEYRAAYTASGQLTAPAQQPARAPTTTSSRRTRRPNVLYGQVGKGGDDHKWWGPAEVMPMARPAYKIDASCGGSDLAGETAAAMAASLDRVPAHRSGLRGHAADARAQLYTFADTVRQGYHDCITDATSFYNSWSGYNDELVWGAIWLYRATGEAAYLAKAESRLRQRSAPSTQTTTKSYKWTHRLGQQAVRRVRAAGQPDRQAEVHRRRQPLARLVDRRASTAQRVHVLARRRGRARQLGLAALRREHRVRRAGLQRHDHRRHAQGALPRLRRPADQLRARRQPAQLQLRDRLRRQPAEESAPPHRARLVVGQP